MALTFADTHNMIAYLTKLDASERFDQIIDFLNASSIKYALTVNPNIYVSCIKQFWSSVSVKKVNDMMRLQALVDRKNVIITEATIREALRLNDAESIDCLPNEEIFTELSRMGVESSADTIMDDQDDASKQGEIIANIDADEDITLKDVAAVEKIVDIEENTDDDELKTTELREVVEVVTTTKLMTEVVIAAATITAATTPITATTVTVAPSDARRRKALVIRDPKETATPSIIIHSEPKSKDKGKWIMVEEPKPLKKQAQIEQDEAYARENDL
nr:xylulose kinase-1 [Tanacetum cinerariifolium]